MKLKEEIGLIIDQAVSRNFTAFNAEGPFIYAWRRAATVTVSSVTGHNMQAKKDIIL